MTTSLLWDVRSRLLTIFATALDGVQIYDGPLAKQSPPKRFVLIGTDGGLDGTADGSEDAGMVATQQSSPMANGWRDETGQIVCSAWAQSGGVEFAPLRADARQIVDLCATSLFADRTLGGLLTPADRFAELAELRMLEAQNDRGAFVRLAFTVAYSALIT